MKTIITWWSLDKSKQTIDTLRQYLRDEGVEPWEKIRGLRLKFWISDRENNLWGAVTLWESSEYISQSLPPNRASELIGYPPTLRLNFDIEAMVEGAYLSEALNKQGLSYESLDKT